jgi:ribose transport system substrate-binding protein
MRRRASLFENLLPIALTGLLASLASCGSEASGASGPDDGRQVVGVSLLTQQHDFYKDLERAMREAADAAELRLIVSSAELDAARQASQLEDFITQRVDAIVVCPVDSSGIGPVVRRANRSDIPVFTADIAATSGEVVSHVASDNVQGGRLAAERMAKLLGGRGKIVVIDHPEVTSVQDRVRGFVEEIARHAGIELVDRPSAGGDRDKAYTVAENMLQAHPDLAGIFAINDDHALGALRAVGDRDVVIIGYDGQPEALDAIRAGGALKADVVQHPADIGRRTVEVIADHLAGRPVDAVVPIEVGMVDRETLAAGD